VLILDTSGKTARKKREKMQTKNFTLWLKDSNGWFESQEFETYQEALSVAVEKIYGWANVQDAKVVEKQYA